MAAAIIAVLYFAHAVADKWLSGTDKVKANNVIDLIIELINHKPSEEEK